MHGIEPLGEDSRISIRARNLHPSFELVVSDQGIGMTPSKLLQVQQTLQSSSDDAPGGDDPHGIGLVNIQNRIVFLCGQGHGIMIDSESGRGTSVTLKLPSTFNPLRSTWNA